MSPPLKSPLRRIACVIVLAALAGGVSAEPAPAMTTTSAAARLQQLQAFRARPKYVPDALYTGVPDAALRERFVARLDELAADLEPLAATPDPKPGLLRAFERGWPTFELADTEDREHTLGYFEELMGIFGVASSDGLLNQLINGFDPTLPADTRNQQAWAAMTDAERTIAEQLQGLSGAAAEAELRRRLGPPPVDVAGTVGWSLDGSLQNLLSISRDGRVARLIWMFRGQLWSRELPAP